MKLYITKIYPLDFIFVLLYLFFQSKRCPMCRREIPSGYLENPSLLQPLHSSSKLSVDDSTEGDDPFQQYQWFYEGRNGWWEYDERTTAELEEAYKESLKAFEDDNAQDDSESPSGQESETNPKSCELLIAGFLYVINFEHMIQYRRNEPQRRRRVKRDVRDQIENRKGVAGLRINPSAVSVPQASQPSSLPGISSNSILSDVSSMAPSRNPLRDASRQDEQDDTVRSLSDRMGAVQLQDDGPTHPSQQVLNSSLTTDPTMQYGIRRRDRTSTTQRSSDDHPDIASSSQPQTNRNLGSVRALNQQRPSSSPHDSREHHSRNPRTNFRGNTYDANI